MIGMLRMLNVAWSEVLVKNDFPPFRCYRKLWTASVRYAAAAHTSDILPCSNVTFEPRVLKTVFLDIGAGRAETLLLLHPRVSWL